MLKKCGRSCIALLLALMLLVPMFAVPASAAVNLTTATFTWGSTKVTVTGTKTNASYQGELNYNDAEKWLRFSGAGFTSGTRKVQNKIELRMTIPANCVLEFDYTDTVTGTLDTKQILYSPDGTSGNDQTITPANGNHYSIGIGASGTTVFFRFYAKGAENSFDATLSNITLSLSRDYDITVNGAAHGSVTVGDDSVTEGNSVTKAVSTANGLVMNAVPASGYTFAGYSINGGGVYQGASNTDADKTAYQYTFFPNNADATITPVFVSKNEANYLVGDADTGYYLTSDFSAACDYAAAHNSLTIIVLTNSTVPSGDYTIPVGTTLVIPNDMANTAYTDSPNVVTKVTTPRAYAKLILEDGVNLTVEGGAALSIAGNLFAPGAGKESSVTGNYGQLVVNEGAAVTVEDGAKLYAWGFATGGGEIECLPGAEAYEMFQINDFAGGTISLNLVQDGRAFPFSQYYVQNIECKLRINAGATETVFGSVYAGSTTMTAQLTFIGDDSAMFTVNEGSVLKYYDFENDKLVCRIDGDAEINPISVSFAGQTIESGQFQLPISNIGVEIASGSTVDITQNLQLLPDSYVTVDEGAQMTINSEIYLIDSADWDGGCHVYNKVNCRPMVYSATRYDQTGSGSSSRTKNGSTDSAKLDNNGTIIIEEGTLNTTPGGAIITSSQGTGSVQNINNWPGLDIILLDFSHTTEVEDMVSESNPETQCADFEDPDTSETFYYDSVRDVWYTTPVSVYFEKDGETIASFVDVAYGTEITPPDATKENTPEHKYTFTGWRSSVDNELYQPADITTALKNVTYTAEYTETDSLYTVTWKNEDGTVLETDENVAYGATPEYNSAEPEKEGGYTFAGWDPAISAVTGDVTYTATYNEPAFNYEVKHSLSLEGQIHVNFYWTLPAGADPLDYSVDFSFMGDTSEKVGVVGTTNGYKSSFAVDAPEMTCEIEATLYYKGEPVATDTYTPAEYAKNYTYTETEDELKLDQPYLIGKINRSVNWSKPEARNLLTLNTEAAGTEYMIQNVPLTKGDTFKVVIYKGEDPMWWYPDGDNNNYTISDNGVYNIYFRQDDYDGAEWWYKHLRVETVSTDNTAYQAALLPTLMQATLNYGEKAQINFDVNASDLADSTDYLAYKGVFGEVTQDMVNAKLGDATTKDVYTAMDVFQGYGLEYYGSSLVLNSSTKIKLYYGVQNKELFEANKDNFTFNDAAVTPAYVSSDVVCFTLDGIAAANLNQRFALSCGSASASYAALDYITLCMDDKDSNPNLYNLMQALYWYNVYADAYFGEA